jgi:pimeloyl-ACP methyl ester carboxylesterase
MTALERPEIKDALFHREKFMQQEEGGAPELRHTNLAGMTVTAPDGTPLNCRIYSGSPDKPHIIYFPAEYESEETLAMLADGMGEYEFNLISLDYRGLGKSGGQPSFEALPSDAEAFYLSVKEWMADQGREGKLAIMGRSLGCAPAMMVAQKYQDDILCLVLESAFDRTSDFLQGRDVPETIVAQAAPEGEDPFANRERIKKITKPVIFIHSPRDQVQSLYQVEWLVAESRSKATQFKIAPAGTREELAHTAGDLYCAVLRQYINLRMGIRPARKPRYKREAMA